MEYNIYLLRHGELRQKNVLAGKTDFTLSNYGLTQLKRVTEELAVRQVISSPRMRCSLFAQAFAKQQGLSFVLEDKISEMDFGDWDGLSYDELWQQASPNIGDFWQNPFAVNPPNGETFLDFASRLDKFWQHLLHNALNQDTLIVTHAGVIKCLLALICGNQIGSAGFEQFVTRVSIGYGKLVQVKVYKEEGFPASVQLLL